MNCYEEDTLRCTAKKDDKTRCTMKATHDNWSQREEGAERDRRPVPNGIGAATRTSNTDLCCARRCVGRLERAAKRRVSGHVRHP